MRLAKSIVGEAEAEAVGRVICDNGYLGMGSEVQAFEREVAEYLGVGPEAVIAVNSGTAALHLAVEAVKVVTGVAEPEILVPSLTFVASFQAISGAGCKPVACEVRGDTGTIDLDDATRRVTEKTVGIMPVHFASNPFQLDKVYAFAKAHDLRVIEDAAHAFGCTWQGKKVGSFGDISCFSFDGIKNITCGEGGCIVTGDEQVARLCKDARLLGVENDTDKRYSGGRSWEFDVTQQGYRYHMSNIMAAIGRVQLRRLPGEFGPARRRLVKRYLELLHGTPNLEFLQMDPEAEIIAHLFVVKTPLKEQLTEALDRAGIPYGRHYKPNHLLSKYRGESLPQTEVLYAQLVSLPLHPELTDEDMDLICRTVRQGVSHA